MTVNLSILLIILGCAVVTIVPRILPFIVIRRMTLPDKVVKWLSFIPICVFTALIVDSFIIQEGVQVTIDWLTLIAILPTVLVAIFTKSLSLTVIIGVITIALLRYVI